MKKKLLYFWLGFSVLLVMGAIQTIPKLSDLLFRTRYVTNVSELTNTVNNFNALSVDGNKRTIICAPGAYTTTTYIFLSNNITLAGSGWECTTIQSALDFSTAIRPIVTLYDNCTLRDVTVFATSTANTAAAVGFQYSGSSILTSTNTSCVNVYVKGDTDGYWFSNAGSLGGLGIADADIECNIYNTITRTKFDTLYTEVSGNGTGNDSPCVVRCFNGVHFALGPSANATAIARGDVSNLRMLGATARQEHYGCSFRSGGGTNLTTIAFLNGPSGADSGNLGPGGGLYLNNCRIDVYGTNLVAGGVGGCIVQNTNGWVFLNGITCNSNNIVGNGTNFWIQPRRIAASTTTTGTAADTLEKDLFSENLMANTFSADGQALQINAWGSYAATANTKALRVKIGGTTTILDTAGRAINGGGWYLHGTITRVSKTALKSSLLFEAPSFTTNVYTSLTLTSTTNINLRLTGSNHTAAANDLVIEGYKLTHIP